MGLDGTLKGKRVELKQARELVARLEHEVGVLEQAQAVVRGKRIAPPTESASHRPSRRGRPPGSTDKLNPDSQAGQAAAVLADWQREEHIDVIIVEMRRRGIEAKKQSLVSTLAKLASHGRYFYRVKGRPSTFGLIELRDKEKPPSAEYANGKCAGHDEALAQ